MPIASKSGMTPSKCSPYKFGSLVAVSCRTVVVGAHSRRQTGTRLWAAPTSSRLQRAPNHHAHESRSATGGVLEILRQNLSPPAKATQLWLSGLCGPDQV